MGNPLVSIVVPVLNEEKTIRFCLESLLAQDLPKNEVEILVVDCGSTDRSVSMIQSYPVQYLFEPIRNRACARNRALAHARGRFAAFTDGDCIPAPNWLRLLMEGFTHEGMGGCGGEFNFPQHAAWVERFFYNDTGEMGWPHRAIIQGTLWPSLWTANAMYDARALRQIGFFDESLVDFEDIDLGWRVSLAGYELRYIPGAHVAHAGMSDLRDMWNRAQEVTVGLEQLFYKYVPLLPLPSFHRWLRALHLLKLVSFHGSASLLSFLKRSGSHNGKTHFLYGFYFLAFLIGLLRARIS